MVKFLLLTCTLATFSVAMGWEVELVRPEYHLAKRPQDLSGACDDLILEMLDCVSYMSDEKTTKPTPTCCKGLKTVLDTNAKCVCFALQMAPSMGINIIMSRAEALPSLCHVTAPPISSCNISTSPAPSPGAPTPSPVTPAPAPVTPNPPTTPPSSPALPPAPSKPPVSPNPPSAPPATPPSPPAKPPSPPATPPGPPVSPTPPSSTPSPIAPVPVVTPPTEAPAPAPSAPSTSAAMHLHMPLVVSFAVVIVSLFFSV